MSKKLVLASTSPFRKAVLAKLHIDFITASPNIDESQKLNEPVESFVKRLSLEKAQAVAEQFPTALIIGSDQVACINGVILGKPLTHQKAIQQLTYASGKEVMFYTGLTLLNTETQQAQTLCDTFSVQFRTLQQDEIERYLQTEKPYHCAGSFKSEALGISLFEKLLGEDPNTLIGLPLIKLCEMLRHEQIQVP